MSSRGTFCGLLKIVFNVKCFGLDSVTLTGQNLTKSVSHLLKVNKHRHVCLTSILIWAD